jgi:hypothetical protein
MVIARRFNAAHRDAPVGELPYQPVGELPHQFGRPKAGVVWTTSMEGEPRFGRRVGAV